VPQLNASGMEHLRCGYSEAVQGYDFNRMVFEFTMLNQGKVCAISTAAMDDFDGRRDVKPDQRRSNLSGCAK
jgi:hypothetical protein